MFIIKFIQSTQNRKYEIVIMAVAHQYFLNFDLKKWQSLCADNFFILDLI